MGKIPQKELANLIPDFLVDNVKEYNIPDQPSLPAIPYLSGNINGFGNVQVWIPQNIFGRDEYEIDVVPIGTNVVSLYQLMSSGKAIVFAPLYECTRGYGAAHCMTGQIHRSDIYLN